MNKSLIAIVLATAGITAFAATDAGNTAKPEAVKPTVTASAPVAKATAKPVKKAKHTKSTKAAPKAKAVAPSASAPK